MLARLLDEYAEFISTPLKAFFDNIGSDFGIIFSLHGSLSGFYSTLQIAIRQNLCGVLSQTYRGNVLRGKLDPYPQFHYA